MERLNKFLAHAGIGSRRHCDTLIAAGRVKVNGRIVTQLATQVDPDAHKVTVDGESVKTERPVYWVVNKPVGYLCTNHDPSQRPLALDLIPHVDQRVYTVGRLDESSEGLLLMTNDGDLAHKLMHPKFQIEKTYQVLVAGKPSVNDLQRLLEGVWLSDGKVRAKNVRRMKPQGESTWLRVVLCEGKNREIRRMLAKLGHKVLQLKRVAIGPILLDKLPKGKSRKLSLPELEKLRKMVSGKGSLSPKGEESEGSRKPTASPPPLRGRSPAPQREAGGGADLRPLSPAGAKRPGRPSPSRGEGDTSALPRTPLPASEKGKKPR